MTYNSPGQSLIPETCAFLQTEQHSTNGSTKCSGHTSSCSAGHKVSLLCVSSKVLEQLHSVANQSAASVLFHVIYCSTDFQQS